MRGPSGHLVNLSTVPAVTGAIANGGGGAVAPTRTPTSDEAWFGVTEDADAARVAFDDGARTAAGGAAEVPLFPTTSDPHGLRGLVRLVNLLVMLTSDDP